MAGSEKFRYNLKFCFPLFPRMFASLTHIRLCRPRAMARPRALSQGERDRKLAEQESYRVASMRQNAEESGAEAEEADDPGESHESHSFVDVHYMCS